MLKTVVQEYIEVSEKEERLFNIVRNVSYVTEAWLNSLGYQSEISSLLSKRIIKRIEEFGITRIEVIVSTSVPIKISIEVIESV
jgi:hypothetical protein